MPEQRPRIPLTVPQLELVFEGLELVAEAATDPGKLREAVELAGHVRVALDRVRARQAAPGG
jgi:hypothetical protein